MIIQKTVYVYALIYRHDAGVPAKDHVVIMDIKMPEKADSMRVYKFIEERVIDVEVPDDLQDVIDQGRTEIHQKAAGVV